MQEEANQKTVGIVVEGGKFTGRMFLRACDKYTQHRRDKKHMRQTDPTKYKVNQPKQITVKQFMKEGEPVRKVELQTPEIKEFEKLARKNGLRFAVMKDKTSEKPQYVIYFKARSGEAIDLTMEQFTRMQATKKDKPHKQQSVHEKLDKFKRVAKENAAKVAKDKTKDIIR